LELLPPPFILAVYASWQQSINNRRQAVIVISDMLLLLDYRSQRESCRWRR